MRHGSEWKQALAMVLVVSATTVGARGAQAGKKEEGKQKLVVCLPHVVAKVFKDLAADFEALKPGVKVVGEPGLIDKIVDQMVAGTLEPDVFLSIGVREMEPLRKHGLLKLGTLKKCAVSPVFVLVVHGNPLGLHSLADLANPKVKTIVIPDPGFNSCGHAFVRSMKTLKLWDAVQGKIITRPLPKAATKLVEERTGADACATYSSCYIFGHASSTHLLGALPPESYPPVTPAAVVLAGSRNTELAREFVDYVAGPEAARFWKKWRFLPRHKDE